MIKAIVFDMDGVIFDTERIWTEAFVKANEIFGFDFDDEVRKSWIGRTERDIRQRLQESFPHIDSNAYRDCICKLFEEAIDCGAKVKPGFVEVVRFARSNGLKTAIATGSTPERVEKLFKCAGLDLGQFVLSCSNDVKMGKPHPEIYLLSAEKLGVAPSEIVVLEDAPNGIESAYSAGCNVVMVVDLIPPTPEVASKCVAVCNDLFEVREFLKKIAGEENA